MASLNIIGQFRNWKSSYIMDESCDGRLHFECVLEDSVIRPDEIFDVSKYIDFPIKKIGPSPFKPVKKTS